MVSTDRGKEIVLIRVKIEYRGEIVIARNVEADDRDLGTNIQKNPAKGIENQRTKIPVRDASRGRSLPSVRKRGEFFLQKFFF